MVLMSLDELKHTELKSQLLQRGLSVTGKKGDLKERLEQALESEGHDPDLFEFYIKSLTGSMQTKSEQY